MIPFDDIPGVTKECLFTFIPMQREVPTYANQNLTALPSPTATEPVKSIPVEYLSNLSLLQSAAAQQQKTSMDMAQAQIQAQALQYNLWNTLSQLPNAANTVAAAAGISAAASGSDIWNVSLTFENIFECRVTKTFFN